MRLLVMEYALPGREYTSLNWLSHVNYENAGDRMKMIHREYLTRRSFHPADRLLRGLAFGKETVKSTGRLAIVMWDTDYGEMKVKGRTDTTGWTQGIREGGNCIDGAGLEGPSVLRASGSRGPHQCHSRCDRKRRAFLFVSHKQRDTSDRWPRIS